MASEQTWGNGKIRYSSSWGNIIKTPQDMTAWEQHIQTAMRLILATQSGQLLVRGISNTPRIMLFVPDAETEMNATTNWTSLPQAFPAGVHFRDEKGTLTTGGGSCTIIEITPQNYSVRSGMVSSADVGLFHEMCHGLHVMMGKEQAHIGLKNATGGLEGYDSMDEFWAISLTNVYLSEKHYPSLRKDHHGREPLEPRLCTSEAFASHFQAAMKLVCDSAPGFTKEIAKVPARFNPYKAYYSGKSNGNRR